MTTLSIQIGRDTGIDTAGEGYTKGDAVNVESCNGCVYITGPFEGWMGYEMLAELDSAEDGDALARRIAADPVAELDARGYDTCGWFAAL